METIRGAAASVVELCDHVGDQPAPTCLVRSPEPATSLAVEVFEEQDVVLEVRVRLHLLVAAEDRPSAVLIAAEDVREAIPQLVRDLLQRQLSSGADRTLDPKAFAEEAVILAQALDQQIVDRHPDRPAPIGVSAEESDGRFGWDIADFGAKAIGLEDIGMLEVI